MPESRRRTRAQERVDEIDVSPTTLIAQIEALTGRARCRGASSPTSTCRAAARARRVPQLQAADRRGAPARPRARQRRPDPQGAALADDFDRAIEARPASIADDPWAEGIAAIDRKLRQLLESEGVTPDRRRARHAPSIRASTRRSPTCPAPAGPRARSSTSSAAATACATASCGRPSWPSPPHRHHGTDDPQIPTDTLTDPRNQGAPRHGQDHRHRPRHDELRRRRDGGRRADRHRVGRRRPDRPLRRRLHQDRRAARRPAGQAPGGHQPRQHRLLDQALHGPSLGRPGGQAQQGRSSRTRSRRTPRATASPSSSPTARSTRRPRSAR